jgi:hypothetical protein
VPDFERRLIDVRLTWRYRRSGMSFGDFRDLDPRALPASAQARQERIAESAAKREMVDEAFRDSDSPRRSVLGRILARLRTRRG